MPTHLEGAADGHEGGLGLGHFHADIGVAVLPGRRRFTTVHGSRLNGY